MLTLIVDELEGVLREETDGTTTRGRMFNIVVQVTRADFVPKLREAFSQVRVTALVNVGIYTGPTRIMDAYLRCEPIFEHAKSVQFWPSRRRTEFKDMVVLLGANWEGFADDLYWACVRAYIHHPGCDPLVKLMMETEWQLEKGAL
jgi:hypothetical protein